MVLNNKKTDTPLEINIGNAKVTQVSSSKLLGVKIEENQGWNEQVNGTGGVLYSAKAEIKKFCVSLPI